MNTEQQRRYRVQLARTRRRQRRIRNVLRLCLTTMAVGLIMVAAIWYDRADGQAAGGTGAGAGTGGQFMTQEQSVQEYPESLLKLLELNPEAEPFVRGYFQNRDKHPEIDLSGEVVQGTIPLFLQWDERWGYETYGSDLIAITGCGPTCLSMVWCGLSGQTRWDPLSMAGYAEKEGYYVKGAGTAWDFMKMGAEGLGLTVEEISFDANHILAWLEGGNPIICAMRPGDFTTTGHFIVLSGLDEYGRVIVRDPNSRSNSEKAWEVDELMPQIKNLWAYRYEQV